MIALTMAVISGLAKLPKGMTAPAVGATCRGSKSALGTSNVGRNGPATTVVNIWALSTQDSPKAGFLVKAHDGSFWYESPVGISYQRVSAEAAAVLDGPTVDIAGCFSKDLTLPK